MSDTPETKHTPEPWTLEPYAQQVPWVSLKVVHAVIKNGTHRLADVRNASDARRIVACVNACEGVPLEWLEDESNKPFAIVGQPASETALKLREQCDELVTALQSMFHSFDKHDPKWCKDTNGDEYATVSAARVALANVPR